MQVDNHGLSENPDDYKVTNGVGNGKAVPPALPTDDTAKARQRPNHAQPCCDRALLALFRILSALNPWFLAHDRPLSVGCDHAAGWRQRQVDDQVGAARVQGHHGCVSDSTNQRVRII